MDTHTKFFEDSLGSGQILVKSVYTGETKVINIKDEVKVCHEHSLSNLEVRDHRIVPKRITNIHISNKRDRSKTEDGYSL
jgi:hypothetical protein